MAELLFQSKQEKLSDGSPIIITKILGAIDGTTVRQFEDKLIGFFNQGVKNLILIFSDVKYINSTGMGLLVKLADKFQEGGGDIKLVGVPEKVIALFDMLGLLSLFKIYDTEKDAIESITPQDTPPAPAPAPPPPPPPPPAPAPRPQPKPAPRPAPAPAPAPPSDDFGDIGGGVVIGDDFLSGDSAPSSPVQFPHVAESDGGGGKIEFPKPGNYRCPRSGAYISIDECGKQTVKASLNSHMMEVRFPCHQSFIASSKVAINSLAAQVNFSKVFCDEVNEALDNALAITIEKSNNNSKESFQILAVADANDMIIGVKALNPFLVQGGPRDPRLPAIARKVDRLEVFPLPNKGQLLKMTKKRK